MNGYHRWTDYSKTKVLCYALYTRYQVCLKPKQSSSSSCPHCNYNGSGPISARSLTPQREGRCIRIVNVAEDAVVTYRTVVLVSLQRKVQTEGSDSREDGFCTSPWYKLQIANGGSVPTMSYIYYMFLYRIIWYIIVQHYLRYRSTVLD